jgi:hypothetical protein
MVRAEDLLFNSLSSPKILLAVLALITVLKTCNPRQDSTLREQDNPKANKMKKTVSCGVGPGLPRKFKSFIKRARVA